MRVVYEADNLIDAHLVRGRLEHEGVPAWVRGQHLTGGMGGLPVAGLVSVCVADAEVPAALAVLERLRSERAAPDDAADAAPNGWMAEPDAV